LIEALGIVGTIVTLLAAGYSVYRYVTGRFFRLSMRICVADAIKVLEEIERQGWRPDLVIGLGRSGALWGGWLAGNLGSLPIMVVDKLFIETKTGRRLELPDCDNALRRLKKASDGKLRALVVEGATTTGIVFDLFEESAHRAFADLEFRTAALYVRRGCVRVPDYYSRQWEDPWPERFPWHYRAAYKRYLHGKDA
jgi:hypoxanthine phosphoribosyltransferase